MSMPPTPPGGGSGLPGSGRRPWMLIGVVFAAVAALVAGLLIWQARSGDAPGADGGLDRTVGLLTEKDPVCDDWIRYADELAAKEERWAELNRDKSAANWTPDEREIYAQVGEAMSSAADQFERLLPRARAIVIQELIAQTVAYLRAYVDGLPAYESSNNLLAGVAGNFGTAITNMCSAVPLTRGAEPLNLESSLASDPAETRMFVAGGNPTCVDLDRIIHEQNALLRSWAAGDASIPADQWSAAERALNRAAREVIMRDAKRIEELAASTENEIFRDILNTRAAYMNLFANSMPEYVHDDIQLWNVVTALGGGLLAACEVQP